MASKRWIWRAVSQVVLLACGIGLVFAWRSGFYACALVLALTAAWIGIAETMSRAPEPVAAPAQEGAGDPLAAQAQQRLLASLLDQSPAPLLALHPDGVVRVHNRAARRLFGVDDRVVSPPPELVQALSGVGERQTINLETPAGAHAYAVALTELISPEGAMRLAALHDIQPEIRAAEAAALRDLLQVLGHEIMNALTPIASLAATAQELLGDQTAAAEQARDAIATLARRADGLNRFVDAYRTLARLPPPQPRPISVNALLTETARVFESRWAAKGVRLGLDLLAPDITMSLDLDLMVHALMNILSNGAEAVADGPEAARYVRLAAEARGEGVVVVIHDGGSGVAPADRERVFQPFFTTKAEGTGVGLSFARQVILAHGGELVLLPPRGDGGARFQLTL